MQQTAPSKDGLFKMNYSKYKVIFFTRVLNSRQVSCNKNSVHDYYDYDIQYIIYCFCEVMGPMDAQHQLIIKA